MSEQAGYQAPPQSNYYNGGGTTMEEEKTPEDLLDGHDETMKHNNMTNTQNFENTDNHDSFNDYQSCDTDDYDDFFGDDVEEEEKEDDNEGEKKNKKKKKKKKRGSNYDVDFDDDEEEQQYAPRRDYWNREQRGCCDCLLHCIGQCCLGFCIPPTCEFRRWCGFPHGPCYTIMGIILAAAGLGMHIYMVLSCMLQRITILDSNGNEAVPQTGYGLLSREAQTSMQEVPNYQTCMLYPDNEKPEVFDAWFQAGRAMAFLSTIFGVIGLLVLCLSVCIACSPNTFEHWMCWNYVAAAITAAFIFLIFGSSFCKAEDHECKLGQGGVSIISCFLFWLSAANTVKSMPAASSDDEGEDDDDLYYENEEDKYNYSDAPPRAQDPMSRGLYEGGDNNDDGYDQEAYYDDDGNPYFYDDNGTPYYYDDDGDPFFIDDNGESVYYYPKEGHRHIDDAEYSNVNDDELLQEDPKPDGNLNAAEHPEHGGGSYLPPEESPYVQQQQQQQQQQQEDDYYNTSDNDGYVDDQQQQDDYYNTSDNHGYVDDHQPRVGDVDGPTIT